MNRAAKIALVVLLLSLAASIAASMLESRALALLFGLPALVLCGWAFFGHFITLDDDLPGGWSNPDESPRIWRLSLAEMAAKGAVFALTVWLVVFFPF